MEQQQGQKLHTFPKIQLKTYAVVSLRARKTMCSCFHTSLQWSVGLQQPHKPKVIKVTIVCFKLIY